MDEISTATSTAVMPERALIRLQNSVPELDKITKEMSRLMDSGNLNTAEPTILHELRERLLEFRKRTDENITVLEIVEACRSN